MVATITGAQIAQQAEQAASAGSPYLFGGNPYTGYSWADFRSDCSGLVDRIFANLGTPLGGRPTTYDLVKMGSPVASIAQALPGDLLFTEGTAASPGHVAVYVGNNQIVEDPTTGQSVHQTALYFTPTAIRRLAPSGTANSTSGPGSSSTATDTGLSIPNPFNLPGDAAGAVGDAITGALDAVAKPLFTFALDAALIIFGLIFVVVGLVILSHGGDSSSSGNPGAQAAGHAEAEGAKHPAAEDAAAVAA